MSELERIKADLQMFLDHPERTHLHTRTAKCYVCRYIESVLRPHPFFAASSNPDTEEPSS